MQQQALPSGSAATVLNVDASSIDRDGLACLLEENGQARFVHVDHAALGKAGLNMIEVARRNPAAKELLILLANKGFMAYVLRGTVTSFVRYDRIGTLWKKVLEGPCCVDENGLVYSLEKPLSGLNAERMLVVFSAMASKIYTVGLMRHFEQNFASIQKYLPAGTAVLRIADLGGVVGSYYMNTHALPHNEASIRKLIGRVAEEHGITRENVVLYGVSKGGSASLYHGITDGYKVVAVDPILADEHYIRVHKDSHFTVGVFPEDKREKFGRLAQLVDASSIKPTAVVCSQRSPQFPFITSILGEEMNSNIAFFNSRHPDIKTHPDVGRATINIVIMLVNMMFYELPIPAGIREVL